MRAQLEAGLTAYGEVSHAALIEFIGDYEDLNAVRTHPIDDASLAHQYKRLITQLGPAFHQSILLRVALLETECRARNEEINPVEIITEAACVVLEDEANSELLKQIQQRSTPAGSRRAPCATPTCALAKSFR